MQPGELRGRGTLTIDGGGGALRPPDARVVELLLQHLVGVVPHDARDVVVLRGGQGRADRQVWGQAGRLMSTTD